MSGIFDSDIKDREAELKKYKETCFELEKIIEDEDATFAGIYDTLMSGKYAEVATPKVWQYVFGKYGLPFSEFQYLNTPQESAVLRDGDIVMTVPMRVNEHNRMEVLFEFWSKTDAFRNIHGIWESEEAKRLSSLIKNLEDKCLNRRIPIYELLGGGNFYMPIKEAVRMLGSDFPFVKKRREVLFKASRDEFIKEIIIRLEERKKACDEVVKKAQEHTEKAKEEYSKVSPKVEELIKKFDGSSYANNISISCPE